MTGRIPEKVYRQCIAVLPRACVDIVPKCNSEVLLLKRRIHPLKGNWALPGGAIYKGEALKEAAIRKVCEELGMKVLASALRFVDVANFRHEDYERHDICLTYVLNLDSKPEIKLDYQHRSFMWIPISKLYDLGEELDSIVIRQIEAAFGLCDSLNEV